MKKVLLFIMVFICFGNVVPNVNASDVYPDIICKEDWNQDYYEYNGLKLKYHSVMINNFWYTGREYIYRDRDDEGRWRYRKSDDMVEWEVMAKTSGLTELSRFSTYSYSINYWGDKYVIFNRLHEWNADAIQGAEHGYIVNKPILILDSDFNLLSQQVSEDAITWTEDNTFTEVPIGNGKNKSLILNGESPDGDTRYIEKIVSVAEQSDISNNSEIVFEKEQLSFYKLIDDIYISWGIGTKVRSFQISLDGVYWIDIDYPDFLTRHDINLESKSNLIIETLSDCIGTNNTMLFKTQYRLFEYNLDDLREVWEDAFGTSQTYVKFNGRYLGFETSPTIEDGSTLVPMRFLFEQMGADVEWNQATQTAKAKLNNTAVTFSIDDIKASVNNTSTTMDVPARLINDKTMVPLRFLSEEMGFDVTWDDASRTAIIE